MVLTGYRPVAAFVLAAAHGRENGHLVPGLYPGGKALKRLLAIHPDARDLHNRGESRPKLATSTLNDLAETPNRNLDL
jgi:hypothetical protein